MAEALLKMVERVARLSAWRVELPDFTPTRSDGMRAIRELPEDFVPILDRVIDTYVPEDRPVLRAAVAECASSGKPFDLELRVGTASGGQLWVRVIGEAVRDEADRICRLEGVTQDITARRNAEDETRRLSAIVVDALDHISDGFCTLDRAWRFIFVNREAERQVGRTRESLFGRVVWDVFPEMLGTVFETSYRHAMDTGETTEFEAWFEPLASWFSVRAYRSPRGLAIYFYNVTKQREARDEARVSEERFRLLAHATSDAIWDANLQTHVMWRSAGFETMFGAPVGGEAAPVDWQSNIHPEDRERVTEGVQRAQNGTGDFWSDEYRYLRADGSYAHINNRGYIIRDASGTPIRMIGGITDLTERKKLEAQFLRAQRLESIGTLAGGIAHDLNNILSPVLISVGLLKLEDSSPEQRQLLDTIETSGKRGAEMVRQVLAFARGVDGKRTSVSIRHLVREVQKILRETIPRNIDLQSSAPVDLWQVNADVTQLNQVLMNLCVNARDAMPEGGTLKIEAANVVLDEVYTGLLGALPAGAYVRVIVSDTGTGMSRETQERIFEPFFSTKDVGKGTGLGLSTVLTIVKSHRGAIDVHSELGYGTTITMHFPVTSVVEAASEPDRPLPRGDRQRILVVDDEEHIRELARKTLERYGYRTLVARHGAEAVALYARHRDVAVVLTDSAMPIMDGLATITALKAMNPMLLTIVASGHSTSEVRARATDAGADAFIDKPYTVEVLVRTIDDVLHQRTERAADGPAPA